MFNINMQKEYKVWVAYSADEEYLIRYARGLDSDHISEEVFKNVLDWKGVFAGEKEVKYLPESVELLMTNADPIELAKRVIFLAQKIMDVSIFFNLGELIKNSKKA